MKALLAAASARFYFRHPWQLALAIAGIALGVAVYVGVALANDGARRAFELSADRVLGTTTHQLVPLAGRLADSAYRELVIERGIAKAAPVIEGRVRIEAAPATEHVLLGVDPLQEAAFRGYSGLGSGSSMDVARLISQPATVILPASLAADLGIAVGDRIGLLVGGALRPVEIVGIAAQEAAIETPIIADVATAQELLDMHGAISRVDLILTAAQVEALERDPLPATTLVPAARRDAAFAEMSRAFRVNLTALSLLALMVGVFLIYATMSFAIVQRRAVLGTLLALGLSRRSLASSVLLEAGALGGVATLIGLLLGAALSGGLMNLVIATLDDLAYAADLAAAAPSRLVYLQGAVLGVLATLLAALGPALDAAHSSPRTAMQRAALERSFARRSRLAAWLALPAAGCAALLLRLDPRSLYAAFAALFCVLAAGALLAPLATVWQMKLLEPVGRRAFGLPGALAIRGVAAALSRTGVAAAALTVAVATVIGIGTMIASFRASLIEWLDVTLRADLYVTADAGPAGERLPEELPAVLRALPGVEALSLMRAIRLPTAHGDLALRALAPGPEGWGVEPIAPRPDEALAALAAGRAVFLAESLAYRLAIRPGGEISLPTAAGPETFPVAAVFRDYNTDGGSVLMALDLYRARWRDRQLTGLGVYLDEADVAVEARVRAALEPALAEHPDLGLVATGEIRRRSLAVFDRTFRITEVLRVLAGTVAFLGILSALLSMQLERAREIALLRATGFTARQVALTSLIQTGLLGLAAGVSALPLGALLAALLVRVINQRSFGWSMNLVVEPAPLLLGVALALGAGLAAGLYPAWRAGRGALAGALRTE